MAVVSIGFVWVVVSVLFDGSDAFIGLCSGLVGFRSVVQYRCRLRSLRNAWALNDFHNGSVGIVGTLVWSAQPYGLCCCACSSLDGRRLILACLVLGSVDASLVGRICVRWRWRSVHYSIAKTILEVSDGFVCIAFIRCRLGSVNPAVAMNYHCFTIW